MTRSLLLLASLALCAQLSTNDSPPWRACAPAEDLEERLIAGPLPVLVTAKSDQWPKPPPSVLKNSPESQ
jgi:hypothetical protein